MAKRVVVEMQMKTIRRYSFQGFISMLFLLVLVAIPVVEFFFPYNVIQNLSEPGQNIYSVNVMALINYTFKLPDVRSLIDVYSYQGTDPISIAPYLYNMYLNTLPYIFIASTAIYACQVIIALVALILVLIFLFTGRWANFKQPKRLAALGLFFGFLYLIGTNAPILLATICTCGGYVGGLAKSYLFFPMEGWLWSLIYFGASFVSFVIIYFAWEYGLVNRIYIGKNRRKNEPEVKFFNKGDYVLVDAPSEKVVETPIIHNEVKEEVQPIEEKPVEKKEKEEIVGTTIKEEKPVVVPEPESSLPSDLSSIQARAFSENQGIINANIPEGIDRIGDSGFSNCLNLKVVTLPKSIKYIGSNCFFNCARLTRINYEGTKAEWKNIKRGSNWLLKAGTKIVYCSDGPIQVNPIH